MCGFRCSLHTHRGSSFALCYELATTVEQSIVEDPLTADWHLLFLWCIQQGLQSTNKHVRFPAKFSSSGTWRRSLWTVRFRSSRPYGSAGKTGLQRDRLMRQLARCDASLYGLLAVEVHCCLLEGLLAFCSRFSQFLAFHQVYFRF